MERPFSSFASGSGRAKYRSFSGTVESAARVEGGTLNALRAAIFKLATVAAALFLGVSASAAAQTHDRIRYAIGTEPDSLNPIFLDGADASTYTELLFEPLFRYGSGGRWVPGLATIFPTLANGGISADGKTITLHLRRRTYWTDGTEVTSRDVKCALDQLMNPKNNVGLATGLKDIANLSTPDAYTAILQLKRPDQTTLTTIYELAPLPAHLLAGKGDLNHDPFNAQPVSNGPYRLVEWKRGDRILLAANPAYWRGKPPIARIELRVVPESRTATLEMKTHELDMIQVTALLADQIPRTDVRFASAASLGWAMLAFNLRNAALSDVRVRRAIALAIDNVSLAKIAGRGAYATDHLLLPMFQWTLDSKLEPPSYDPDAASRLLDDAGWQIGDDGLRHKGPQTLSLSMFYATGGVVVAQTAIAASLERVHIQVDQRPLSPAILYATADQGGPLANRKFDLVYLGYETNPDPDMSWLFACRREQTGRPNLMGYCNPEMDAAFQTGKTTSDPAKRIAAYETVQQMLFRDLPVLVLWRVESLYAYADWIHGIDPSPYSPFWNVYAWSAR